MKKILQLAFFSCCLVGAFAQKSAILKEKGVFLKDIEVKKNDSLLIIEEAIFDFGKIPQGKPVQHDFEIINAGKNPIKLINVQASCGCTTPEWDKDNAIAAGGKSKIKIGYNAASEGLFNKLITITYNENQTKQITIKGEVWKTPAASAPANTVTNELKE